jgi:L-aspartate oxidase
LLEAVVFAERAAQATGALLADPLGRAPGLPAPRSEGADTAGLDALRDEIRDILWMGAGIVRDDAGLAAAERALGAVSGRVPSRPSTAEAAEVANLFVVGKLIVQSAILRKESRGLHFSRSHPDSDPAFQCDTIIRPIEGKEPPP